LNRRVASSWRNRRLKLPSIRLSRCEIQAKELFAQALDIVVQIGWREGQRRALGVWEVAGLERGEVKFRTLWQPGDARLGQITRRRG